MATPSLSLRPVETAVDRRRIEAMLAANDLPTADLDADPLRLFLADAPGRDTGTGTDTDAPVGCGGFERYGADGLLRSVVVRDPARGAGYGTALVAALAERAERAGVTTLYLLTTDATGFFERVGFERIDRSAAPEAIRATREFAALCPASATCMRRPIG